MSFEIPSSFHPSESTAGTAFALPHFDHFPNFHPGRGSAELPARVEWAGSIKDAVMRAQESGKPVIMVFEEPNCGWCQQYDKELAKPEVAALSNNAIFVRANPALDPDARVLANNLGITSYPTTSIIDINGSHVAERSRTVGYITANDLVKQFGEKGAMMA